MRITLFLLALFCFNLINAQECLPQKNKEKRLLSKIERLIKKRAYYDALDKFAVPFNPTETSKEVIVKTTADINSEGTESFFFDLFTTFAKAKEGDYHTYSTGYIKDPANSVVNAINDNGGQFSVTTLQGNDLTLKLWEGDVYVKDAKGNKAKVIITDVETSNGVIHAINNVVLPE